MSYDLYMTKSAKLNNVALNGVTVFSIDTDASFAIPKGNAQIRTQRRYKVGVDEVIHLETEDLSIATAIPVGDIPFEAVGVVPLTGADAYGGTLTLATVPAVTGGGAHPAGSVTILKHSLGVNMEGKPVVRMDLGVNSYDGVASGVAWTAAGP